MKRVKFDEKKMKSLLLLVVIGFSNAFSFKSCVSNSNCFQYQNRARLSSTISLIENEKLKFGLGKIAFSLIPLSPEAVGRRKTIFQEILPGSVWTLDQVQGIINVNGKF